LSGVVQPQTLITYGDGTTDSYSQYDADDNLLTLTQNFAGAGNSVSFSYGWFSNRQRQSVGVDNNAFQYVPSVPMTVSYYPADVNNGYTGSSSTPSGLSAAYTYDGNQNLTYFGARKNAWTLRSSTPATAKAPPLGTPARAG
jgi:hypothetical protein